jgi:hypothetical protein
MQINYYLGQAAWNLPFTLETLTMSKPLRIIDPLCHQMPTNHQTNHQRCKGDRYPSIRRTRPILDFHDLRD